MIKYSFVVVSDCFPILVMSHILTIAVVMSY